MCESCLKKEKMNMKNEEDGIATSGQKKISFLCIENLLVCAQFGWMSVEMNE